MLEAQRYFNKLYLSIHYLFLIILNRFLYSLGLGAPQENIEVDELGVFLDQFPVKSSRIKITVIKFNLSVIKSSIVKLPAGVKKS